MVIIGQLIINYFDKGSNNMKGLEPAVNKRFRTSKLCNGCNNELETFMEKPSKKPKVNCVYHLE